MSRNAQNPDTFFQVVKHARHIEAVPDICRSWTVFAKQGAPLSPLRLLRSPSEKSLLSWVLALCNRNFTKLIKGGEKVGVLSVHLFRPFDIARFLNAMPATVSAVAVLDRSKDPAAICEPLCADVREALSGTDITVIGGRYGLSSKDFTPAMAKGVFDELKKAMPKTLPIGIDDDVVSQA